MEHKPNFTKETNLQIQHLMDVILAMRFTDLDKDYDSCLELLQISQKENYLYGIAFAYAYLGDCLLGKNQSVNASTNLLQAKKLCEENRFLDLLPYVCTWLGIYYEMQNDRQMAMQYYLDALEFAERNHDLLRQSILLNNIASQFNSSGNREVAKEYYLKAFDCYDQLEHSSTADPHYAQMTANLISVCCHLKQIQEAEYYFSLLKRSGQLEENQNQLYLCQLLIASAVGDMKATHESVDKLLIEMQKQPKNLHQFFETFLIVADSMVALDEPDYAKKLLMILDDLCKTDEYGHRLKVQYVWMRYYKRFGTEEEKNQAYREFYELRQLSDAILNRNLADGLLSKIKLRESMKKNQEMEQENKKLEGEMQLDELTQLYNRRSFRQLTEALTADEQLHSLCLIMIDVDYFKQYNDTYGHSKGDEALCSVAACINSTADKDVHNFRYGGDEFVSICTNKTVDDIEVFISSFSEALRQKQIPHEASPASNQVTLSIGYSFHQRPEGYPFDTAKMLWEADKALYQAKDLGRNCHCCFSQDIAAE